MATLSERVPLPAQAAALRGVFALPRRARRRLAGRPIRIDGQDLALDAQLLLRMFKLSRTTLAGVGDPAEIRARLEASASIVADRTVPHVATRELSIPTADGPRPARLYRPARLEQPAPSLVFYHGGGFAMGSLDSHDNTVRFLAVYGGVQVLSVDYRLAPEDPFPAGCEDAVAAFDHVYDNAEELGVDRTRIAVGGDSAGGNLSAVVAQQTTLRGGPAPAFQLLIYPAVDFTVRRRSRELFGAGFFLTSEDMDWFEGHYIPPGVDKADPRLSPLLADDLRGLPPTYVVTAGFDPLRDEGEEYADALRKAGVPVALSRQPDLIHGFVNFLGVGRRFRDATLEIAGALRTGLALSRSS